MASSIGRGCLWTSLGIIALIILARISDMSNSGTSTSGSAVSSALAPPDTMITAQRRRADSILAATPAARIAKLPDSTLSFLADNISGDGDVPDPKVKAIHTEYDKRQERI